MGAWNDIPLRKIRDIMYGADSETCWWCRQERPVYQRDDDGQPVCRDCYRKFMMEMVEFDPFEDDPSHPDES